MDVECILCDKSFSNNSRLNNHTVNDRREKSYKCSQCHKTLPDNSKFIKHIRTVRTHTGEEPYHAANVIKIYQMIVI